ncbi:MAG: hypothetical protein ACP5O6_07265 [Candidatus Baltobacteraceae bacterium]
MNLLASPWTDAIERTTMVLGKKSLRTPLLALTASVVLVGIGNATITGQVSQVSEHRIVVLAERTAMDRNLVAAHLRERRLRSDLALIRRIAAIERDDRRMLESVAAVANDAPSRVWFVSLTIDHHILTLQAKTDSFAAISAMLRSTAQRRTALLPRVRSVLRSTDATNPIIAFTMEVRHAPRATDRGIHDRT